MPFPLSQSRRHIAERHVLKQTASLINSPDSKGRCKRRTQTLIRVTALILGGFVFFTAAFGAFETLIQRSIFVALISILGMAIYPPAQNHQQRGLLGTAIDTLLVLVVVSSAIYIIVRFKDIMGGGSTPVASKADIVMGTITTLTILEIARRAVGLVFPLVIVATILYSLFGHRIPGSFGHRGFSIGFIIETIFLSDRGLWGLLVGIASRTLAAFVLFGNFLLFTGAGQTFFDLSARLSGRAPGGAAKIAVIASSLFGAINGSTVANVATTGNFTIPLMKRLKYPGAYAAGVEAIASTGGQIAPPVMGTAAFVMAEIVGVNYWFIALSAILPAVVFYLGVFLTVHVMAVQKGLGKVSEQELPDWKVAIHWRRLAPIIASVLGIGIGIFNGNSIQTTAFFGIVAMVGVYIIANLTAGGSVKKTALQLLGACEAGGKGLVVVGILLTAAQVFVGLLNLTGLGVAITSAILAVAGGNVWGIAVIMAAVCLLVGMGLPTSAAYILVSSVFASALIQSGVDKLTVHFFIFYYATLSVITPPVCVGVFVAASIAKENWFKVALYTIQLGAVAYVLPSLFILYPGMLGMGGFPAIIEAAVTGITFTVALSFFFGAQPAFFSGAQPVLKHFLDRMIWFVCLLLAIVPSWPSTILAAVILLTLVIRSRLLENTHNKPLQDKLRKEQNPSEDPAYGKSKKGGSIVE